MNRGLWLVVFASLFFDVHVARAEATPARGVLAAEVDAALADGGVAGATIAVTDATHLMWTHAYGLADRGSGRAMEVDTPQRVGSISKTVVALGILLLVERGQLALDARLVDVAPEIAFDNAWERETPLRLVHLLEHTPGFDDMRPSEMLTEDPPPLAVTLAAHPGARRCRWRPGTRESYSNVGYAVLGYLIEKKTGTSFEAFAEREILRPLGMNQATFVFDQDLERRVAHGHVRGTPMRHVRMAYRPVGELVATASETAMLARFWLRDGHVGEGSSERALLAPATITRAETPSFAASLGVDVGYGFGTMRSLEDGARVLGHSGGMDGFTAEYRYLRESGVGWAIVLNSHRAIKTLAALHSILTHAFAAPGRFTDRPVPEPSAALDLAGHYRPVSPRFEMAAPFEDLLRWRKVTRHGEELVLEGEVDPTYTLVASGARTFRRRDEVGTSVAFAGDGTALVRLATYARASRGAYVWHRSVHVALAVLAIAALGTLIWLPVFLVRRRRGARLSGLGALACTSVAALSALVALGAGASLDSMQSASTVNPASLALAVLPWVLLGATTKAAVDGGRFLFARATRPRTLRSRAFEGYVVLTVVAAALVSTWFIQSGLVGLRVWKW